MFEAIVFLKVDTEFWDASLLAAAISQVRLKNNTSSLDKDNDDSGST